MRRTWTACLAGLLLAPPCAPARSVAGVAATAASTPPAVVEIVDHETVVVSGTLPGPGLWKVRKGGHTLYVLATLSPLPRRMEWQSAGVESVVARAGQVLLPPSFTLDADVGVLRGLSLLPSLLKARRNPGDRTLSQVLPPDLHARWAPLRQRYLGNDRGVEKWRPIFAAQELYEAAMRRTGLSLDGVVDKAVRRMARRHRVPMRAVDFRLEVAEPKAALAEFRATVLADSDCFERTLSRIEGDLEAMRRRANAWAEGDIATLRALPFESQYSACVAAVTGSGLAQRLGAGDMRGRLEAMWIAAAEDALDAHATALAMLPLGLVLGEDGWLARLEAKGYVVEPP